MSWRVGSPCRRFSIFQGAQGRKGLLILKTFLVFPRDVPLCPWSSSLQIRRCWREDKILLAVTFSLQGSASGEGQAEATSPRTPLGSSGSSTDGSFSKCLTWSHSIFLAYLRLGKLVVFTVSLVFSIFCLLLQHVGIQSMSCLGSASVPGSPIVLSSSPNIMTFSLHSLPPPLSILIQLTTLLSDSSYMVCSSLTLGSLSFSLSLKWNCQTTLQAAS